MKPSSKKRREPARFFVSIGIPDPGQLERLRYVESDVERMRRLFVDGLRYQDISLGSNLSTKELTEALQQWLAGADLRLEDEVVVYYSGHGCVEANHHYLVTRDVDLRAIGRLAFKTETLVHLIVGGDDRPGRLWLILDCCNAAGVMNRELFEQILIRQVDLFVLAASNAFDPAHDGAFCDAFLDAVEHCDEDCSLEEIFRLVSVAFAQRKLRPPVRAIQGSEPFEFLRHAGAPVVRRAAARAARRGRPKSAVKSGARRAWRSFGGGLLIAAGALAVLGGVLLFRVVRRLGWRPPPGMIAVRGASLALGTDQATAQTMYEACRAAGVKHCDADGGFKSSPFARQVRRDSMLTAVSSFWLDAVEVSNEKFSAWLTANTARLHNGRWPRPASAMSNAAGGPMPRGLLVLDAGMHRITAVNDADDPGGRYDIAYRDRRYEPAPDRAALPAVHVSWNAAASYCRSLGKRLPTQAEWELAARGAAARAFPWGDEPAGGCAGISYSSDDPGCRRQTAAPVGSSQRDRTPEGIYDLAGNVTEWTSDPFEPVSSYDEQHCRLTPCRIARGASYADTALWLHPEIRYRFPEETLDDLIGFRCALDQGAP